ncbi:MULTISPECIES: DUF2231 domain-containing protein [Halomonadaceae]|jgi:uncharacterized membrane protein|uniref:DUF2231 domain-containing protein n=3 Tax=Bacteria TaxID=2 RepID=A0A8H9I1V8_9GAMM|nr:MULTISPECIES: DUF2231 domain-containing protein [Halomonas]ATH78493.1 DUF2231 domain-containing protein [Halomonas hydrothermalis]KHJ50966.1 membrane protein [Halomonas hydrothermalis]MDM7480926.1 DUF2231 domain-containing protein [Halomonas sp.]NGO88273.1 DUF2231 domain-containing protein [Halomonas sp.]PJX13544.1 DUF2231 domain-containing protein [Halomonas sp. 141]
MAPTPQRSIKSRASLAGHPLHPVMIHFPVAALMALVASDLAYWYTEDPFWMRSGLWLAGVGAFGGWVASIAGIIDLVTVSRIRRLITGWSHAIVAVVMLSLASFNWLLRFNEPDAILPWGLAVSLLTGGLIALAGWLGGQLVYEHAVGVDVD